MPSAEGPHGPCDYLLESLKACLLNSDCVLKQRIKPSVCIKEHMNELPDECKQLRRAHFECKRGMLDMRNRFRGNTTAGSSFKRESPQSLATGSGSAI